MPARARARADGWAAALWRTSTARLTVLYGVVFALGVLALLGMIYLQSIVYLTTRLDTILRAHADALAHAPPAKVRQRIEDALNLDGDQIGIYGLFSPDGQRLAGNLSAPPPRLRPDGPPVETPPNRAFRAEARLIARRLPSGEELVVGRNASQLLEMRAILASALVWSGVWILLVGLGCGVALSSGPLRRVRLMQAVARDIAAGDLKRRMPISGRRDELDMFAAAVNTMMGEVERLMSEVKGATETIAHDLRTPLTRARTQLHRLNLAGVCAGGEITKVMGEIDAVLERFRALLRISELEASERRAGFSVVDLSDIARQAVDLYQPLAETEGVQLDLTEARPTPVDADPKLLFEAVSNLVDNAIKFTGRGGHVRVGVGPQGAGPQILVQDDGPGIPAAERTTVLQRFYRGGDKRLIAGSGLGLSIVAAIVRLHRFQLTLQDAHPGLKAVIDCTPVQDGLADPNLKLNLLEHPSQIA